MLYHVFGKRPFPVLFLALVTLGACSEDSAITESQTNSTSKPTDSTVSSLTPQAKQGRLGYASYCASCHQMSGKGAPPTVPSLAGSEIAQMEDTQALAKLILKGGFADKTMPRYEGILSPKDLAAILTYVRSAWGNSASAVSAEDITEISNEN